MQQPPPSIQIYHWGMILIGAISYRGYEAEVLHPPAMAPLPLFFAPLLGFQVPPASGSHQSPEKLTRNSGKGNMPGYPVSQTNHRNMDTKNVVQCIFIYIYVYIYIYTDITNYNIYILVGEKDWLVNS